MTDSSKAVSLVLSIFKGEDFVNNQLGSFKFQIQASCNSKIMESNVIQAVPSNSEPPIQSQLAWPFTRSEMRKIRTNREVVKVSCMLVHDDGRKSEMGYAVMHVRDAFVLKSFDEIDPSKARVVSLKGTKANWFTCLAKLHMSLHVEEAEILPQLLNSLKKPVMVVKQSELKKEVREGPVIPIIPKKPTLPIMEEISRKTERLNINIPKEPTPEMLEWKINESEGFFELGKPSEHDDFYIVNITIISASNLHTLWNGRTTRKQPSLDDHVWLIRYKAYGCEIKSDPFVLSSNDETKRTFIGDKATARIRANPIAWISYLDSSFIEFQILRYRLSSDNQLIDEEIMGFSCAELKDLANPNISELKAVLEINSEWGYPQNADPESRPEVRVVFEVEAIPDFFADKLLADNQNSTHDDSSNNCNISAPQEVLNKNIDVASNDTAELNEIIEQIKEMELNAANRQGDCNPSSRANKGVQKINEGREKPKENAKEKFILDKDDNLNRRLISPLNSKKPVKQPGRREPSDNSLDDPIVNDNFNNEKPPDSKKAKLSPEVELESLSKHSRRNDNHIRRRPVSPEIVIIETEISGTSTSDTEGDKENVERILPKPGDYKITIELVKLFLCCRNSLNDELILSYLHPQFGMKETVYCQATPSITKKRHASSVDQFFQINNAAFTLTNNFRKFCDQTINEPLTINLQQCYKSSTSTFAFCMLPIGSVFLQEQDQAGVHTLTSGVDILKLGTNITIGRLIVKVLARNLSQNLNRLHSSNPRHRELSSLNKESTFSPSPKKYFKPSEDVAGTAVVDKELVFHTIHELNRWKAEQEKIFLACKKEKEQAYLRILAEENQKREQEREKVTTEKIRECKLKEKEYSDKLKQVLDKEERLKQNEIELTSTAHKQSLKNASVLENTKIHIRRLQEENQIEVSSLQRRLEESESEVMKLKGKVTLLDRKLEEKDDTIAKLKQDRYSGSEAKLAEAFRNLEQENATLRREKAEIEKSRDKYKKQSQALCFKLSRLQDDLDKQVKDENENLRLQILASKEHKELKKERKAITELSEKVQKFKDTSKLKEVARGGGPEHTFSMPSSIASKNEEEIKRLNDQRNGLLNTGAYTQYDMVIKEMERRIVQLAKGDSNGK